MRYNYASSECAARIISTNKNARSAHAILNSHSKDSYMLNLCSDPDKHVIIELCQPLMLDTISMANYELFSSTFRIFRVSVSSKLRGPFRVLGEWQALDIRGEQEFTISSAPHFIRYVRFDFLTHHQHEYFCPVSCVKVFGKTMMEDFYEEQEERPNLLISQQPSCLLLEPKAISEEDNVFKAIHERLCMVERALGDLEEQKSQIRHLGRIIVNMANRSNQSQLSGRQIFPVSRLEICGFSAITCIFLMLIYHLILKSKRFSSMQQPQHHRTFRSDIPPLETPNSDYLGVHRTPLSSPK